MSPQYTLADEPPVPLALDVGTLGIIDLGGHRVVDRLFLDAAAVQRLVTQRSMTQRAELVLHPRFARNLETEQSQRDQFPMHRGQPLRFNPVQPGEARSPADAPC